MMIPVRCFTCGALTGDKWERYKTRVDRGEDPENVLDSLGVRRYCCRRMLASHVDIFEEVASLDSRFGKSKMEE